MSDVLRCYSCGAPLAALTLPLSRRDMCPTCSRHLHVCRMCVQFDPAALGQCREEEAEEVRDKERVNFCEWFEADFAAFDPERGVSDDRARAELDALFGAGDESADDRDSDALGDAEKLFR